MKSRITQATFPLFWLCLIATGCGVSGPYATGLLTVDWYIEGEIFSVDCRDTNSDYLNLVLLDGFDFVVADEEARCEDFTMTLELEPGRYYPEVTLVDRFDQATSSTLVLPSVLLLEDDDYLVEVDFFASDFF